MSKIRGEIVMDTTLGSIIERTGQNQDNLQEKKESESDFERIRKLVSLLLMKLEHEIDSTQSMISEDNSKFWGDDSSLAVLQKLTFILVKIAPGEGQNSGESQDSQDEITTQDMDILLRYAERYRESDKPKTPEDS